MADATEFVAHVVITFCNKDYLDSEAVIVTYIYKPLQKKEPKQEVRSQKYLFMSIIWLLATINRYVQSCSKKYWAYME